MDLRFPDPNRQRRLSEQEQLEEQIRQAAATTRFWAMRLVPLGILILLMLWLASGVYTVGPGEVGVVRHFGREIGRTSPGLHYRLPWPIQQADVVSVEAIRRAEIGFRTDGDTVTRVNSEALMLTGDENIVDAQIIVQYRVSNPSYYLFQLRDADEALRASTEVALRNSVGQMRIDDVLTVGRAQVQEETRIFLQQLLDTYQSGLQVTDVKLQVVDPPEQVKDAFHEVVRAREDREKLINEAHAYQEDILPKARGQAQAIRREAEAYQEQRVIQSQGDAARFVAVLIEYQKSTEVTRDRLHLEVVERILPKLDKIIMESSANSNVLPFLPLRGTPGSTASGQTTAPAAASTAEPQP